MTDSITLQINQSPVAVRAGVSVMAALSLDGPGLTRYSVLGEPRSAVCGMGICQECRVWINGVSRLACQTLAAEGMVVQTATLEGNP
ncbi:MAG: (2Fe-2S)-binding protein [Curvibacter sp.]|nr:MAG: (2Fe-2S)-binding protein [Curvibacter sp.]